MYTAQQSSLNTLMSNVNMSIFTHSIQSCLKNVKYNDIIMDESEEDLGSNDKIRAYNALRRIFKRILERGCKHEDEVKLYIKCITNQIEELRCGSLLLRSICGSIEDGKLLQDLIVKDMDNGERKPFHSLKRIIDGLINHDPVKYEKLLDTLTTLDVIIEKIDSSDVEPTEEQVKEYGAMLFHN